MLSESSFVTPLMNESTLDTTSTGGLWMVPMGDGIEVRSEGSDMDKDEVGTAIRSGY